MLRSNRSIEICEANGPSLTFARGLYSPAKGAKASLAAGGEPAGEAHRSWEAAVVPAEALGFGREGPRVLQTGLGWGGDGTLWVTDHLSASLASTLTQPPLPPNKADGSPVWFVEQGAGLWGSGGGSGDTPGARAAAAASKPL